MAQDERRTRRISGRDPASGEAISVAIEDGRIAAIEPARGAEEAWLCAGLVDLQINGFGGHDVNAPDISAATVVALARAVAATGVARFLATIITASQEQALHALRAVAEARREDAFARHAIPGVHMEGPSISPEDGPRGAHPRRWARAPSLAEFDEWQAASANLVRLVTLSPHWPEAPSFIAALHARGVRVAIGHTHADSAQIAAAVEAGASLSTHLGNGAHAMLPRHPNYLWSQLAQDPLSASFIADGHHLPAETLRAMIRAKGLERSILVSDAVALAGMPPGDYETPVGGRVTLSADGRLSVANTVFLAGAARPLIDGVAHVARLEGFSLADAIAMATKNPGRFIGAGGDMRIGAPADLLRFRWREGGLLRVEEALAQGARIA